MEIFFIWRFSPFYFLSFFLSEFDSRFLFRMPPKMSPNPKITFTQFTQFHADDSVTFITAACKFWILFSFFSPKQIFYFTFWSFFPFGFVFFSSPPFWLRIYACKCWNDNNSVTITNCHLLFVSFLITFRSNHFVSFLVRFRQDYFEFDIVSLHYLVTSFLGCFLDFVASLLRRLDFYLFLDRFFCS